MVPEAQAAHFRSFNSLLLLPSLLDRQMLPLHLVYLCHERMQGTTLAEHVFASFPSSPLLLGLESNRRGGSQYGILGISQSPHVSDAGSDCSWSLVWLVHCPAAGCVSRKDSLFPASEGWALYWWGCIHTPELNGSPARMWVLREEDNRVLWPLSPLYVGKCSH